jgi:catechol 2,3-dioxygenase-like lactoylglutathione lyase family enzyme
VSRFLGHITLLVNDYDEAITHYTETLDFYLVEDTKISENKRWVLITPDKNSQCSLLLAKAANQIQMEKIGNQTGGRVFLFLYTDNFYQDYEKFLQKGVVFVRLPKEEPYGIVAVFEDLYGNLWDLIQPF